MYQPLLTREERLEKIAGIIAPMLAAGGLLLGGKTLLSLASRPKGKGVGRMDAKDYPIYGKGIDRGDYFAKGDTVYHNTDKWTPLRSMLSNYNEEEQKTLRDLGHLGYNHVYDNDMALAASGDLFRNMRTSAIVHKEKLNATQR